MATLTRSRRVEHPLVSLSVPQLRQPSAQQLLGSPPRQKRPLDLCDNDLDAIKRKKARITVEILSKQQHSPNKSILAKSQALNQASFDANRQVPIAHQQDTRQAPPLPQQQPPKRPQQADHSIAVNTNHAPKYREKVVNGIKHELEQLQPSMSDAKDAVSGRKLRSQEASRFKSELAAYFPDYDEVIGNDPKEQHVLNIETPIVIVDPLHNPTTYVPPPMPHASSASTLAAIPTTATSRSTKHALSHDSHPVRRYPDALFTDLFDSQRIDFSFLETQYHGKTPLDPLPDSAFEHTHRKAERLEKSIRNTERGRAQHEKGQIIRLLEGLQGHDWLRTMGVSGITETRKKQFEPAREHFIKGCKAILEKFRLWGLEEKRMKLEKDRAAAADKARDEGEESDEDEDMGDEEAIEDSDEEARSADEDGGMLSDDDDANTSSPSSDTTDVAASIAKQLLNEAMARSKKVAAKRTAKRARSPEAAQLPPPKPEKPFASFFAKPYQREAALSKSRRKGRSVLAWGHPVPELGEMEFELPSEYRDDELMKSRERTKRRDRRESKH